MRKQVTATLTALTLAAPLAVSAAGTGAVAAPDEEQVSKIVMEDAVDDVWMWDKEAKEYVLSDVTTQTEILEAVLRHGPKNIVIKVTLEELQKKYGGFSLGACIRSSKAHHTAWVDAGPKRGWEGVHSLWEWPPKDAGDPEKVPSPGFEHEIDYGKDTITMTIPRKLVHRPDWVKARMAQFAIVDGQELTDNPHNATATTVYSAKVYKP